MPELYNTNDDNCLRRDLLRDFCLAAASLEEQFARFDASGALSFAIISDITGSEFNKGLLWHIKDTAHQLFKNKTLTLAAGQLDWTIGFLFHECLQILEAAYQLQHYVPRLTSLYKLRFISEHTFTSMRNELDETLLVLAAQSGENLKQHIRRGRELISAAKELFCRYLAGCSTNRQLARLIHDREKLLRSVFGDQFEALLQSIYGTERELIFLETALSLAELGQMDKAALAVKTAIKINPHNPTYALLLEGMLAPTTTGD
jgi:hypothetical protein